jgi:hypothetical protein
MQIRTYLGLAVLPLFFAACPSLLASSYTWNFTTTGSGETNCPVTSGRYSCANPGNSMTFTTGGLQVTVTAWYVNGAGTVQQATLGQYSSGLGICYEGENCSGSNQEINNNSVDEFLLFQFSAPVDPASITLDLPTKGGMSASYWLGSTTNKSINLTNMDMGTSLSTLGFGAQNNMNGGTGKAGSTHTMDFNAAPPTNAILFGTMYGYSGDNFDISGITASPLVSVPEPTSVFLLFTVIVGGLSIHRWRRSASLRVG